MNLWFRKLVINFSEQLMIQFDHFNFDSEPLFFLSDQSQVWQRCIFFVSPHSRAAFMERTGHPSSAPRPLWPNWDCSRQWSPRWPLSWTATPPTSGTWSTWRTHFSRTPSSRQRTTRASWSSRWGVPRLRPPTPKNKAHKQQLKSAHLNWPLKKGTLELQPDGHLRMKQLEKLDTPAGGKPKSFTFKGAE